MTQLLNTLCDLVPRGADKYGDAPAVRHKGTTLSYGELHLAVQACAAGLVELGLRRYDRVAILAGKQAETVISLFGVAAAGGIFVPVNALLKPKQVVHILNDCDVRALVTTRARFQQLQDSLGDCRHLEHIILLDAEDAATAAGTLSVTIWNDLLSAKNGQRLPVSIASDVASIMYTSGSTGLPKGVVLSHANMLIGAASVAEYIGNSTHDRILAVLPLSFDAGLSQLTTGLYAGSCVVLHDYLLARDVVRIVERERITGITAVPPLYIQLTGQAWPAGSTDTVRYFANTGGKMPGQTLAQLREIFPAASPFLMYGLTEAFRSTYLPPSEVDTRPDSIGKAIPNAEILVVAQDGGLCKANEVGELVHRGPLVSLGYWNDAERTAKRFRPAPGQPGGLPNEELAVWSGDSVRMDDDGYLYFVGRMDEMIKTSGYRVSPAEVEEAAYATGLVEEVAALGVPHPALGQAIVLAAKAREMRDELSDELTRCLKAELPNYMIPLSIQWQEALPRNPNGKLDRPALTTEFANMFDASAD